MSFLQRNGARAEGGAPRTAPVPPRSFVGPFIGIAVLFAAIGPPVGGATFFPLAMLFKAPAAMGTFGLSALLSSLFGHWLLLLPAYFVGVGPAVATGVLYALWDAAAPDRWPRALAAGVIGAVVAYVVAQRLAAFGASLELILPPDFDVPAVQSIAFVAAASAPSEPGPTGIALVRAFAASGGVAGIVCAMTASLLGLTMRPAPGSGPEGGA
jgi:hypothetical protein